MKRILLAALLMLGPTFLFGIYIVTHGQVSPGGGFQGGVILGPRFCCSISAPNTNNSGGRCGHASSRLGKRAALPRTF